MTFSSQLEYRNMNKNIFEQVVTTCFSYWSSACWTWLTLSPQKYSWHNQMTKLTAADFCSLLLRFVDNTFDPDQSATIGVDFKVKTVNVDGNRVKLAIWVSAVTFLRQGMQLLRLKVHFCTPVCLALGRCLNTHSGFSDIAHTTFMQQLAPQSTSFQLQKFRTQVFSGRVTSQVKWSHSKLLISISLLVFSNNYSIGLCRYLINRDFLHKT